MSLINNMDNNIMQAIQPNGKRIMIFLSLYVSSYALSICNRISSNLDNKSSKLN